MAVLNHLIVSHEAVKQAAEKTKLAGRLSVQVNFDRSKPIVRLYDHTSYIELNETELEALRDWLNQP